MSFCHCLLVQFAMLSPQDSIHDVCIDVDIQLLLNFLITNDQRPLMCIVMSLGTVQLEMHGFRDSKNDGGCGQVSLNSMWQLLYLAIE